MNSDLPQQSSLSSSPVAPAFLLSPAEDAQPAVPRPPLEPGRASAGAQARPVRRYLRHRVTQQYYRTGGWTLDISEAQAFSDVIQASRTCVGEQLTEVEIVLRLSGGTDDLFCTPLR
jgi:hypothetical protein